MARLLAGSTLLLWAGGTLVLSELRWFNRRPLTDRLRPYEPGGMIDARSTGRLLSVTSFREVIGPIAQMVGERIAGLIGVNEPLGRRLERIHAPTDVMAFRVRQLGWSMAALTMGALLTATTRPPLLIALLFTVGGGLLGFLVVEQQLAAASTR